MSPLISQTRNSWREVDKLAQNHTIETDRVRIQRQVLFYQRPHCHSSWGRHTVMNRSEEVPAVTIYGDKPM